MWRHATTYSHPVGVNFLYCGRVFARNMPCGTDHQCANQEPTNQQTTTKIEINIKCVLRRIMWKLKVVEIIPNHTDNNNKHKMRPQ